MDWSHQTFIKIVHQTYRSPKVGENFGKRGDILFEGGT
jgi:hypothetical protein